MRLCLGISGSMWVQAWRLWFNCIEAWERSGDFLERAIRRVGSCIYLCTGFTIPLFLPPPPYYPQLCSLRLLSSRQVCQTPLLALRGLVPGSFPWEGLGGMGALGPTHSPPRASCAQPRLL